MVFLRNNRIKGTLKLSVFVLMFFFLLSGCGRKKAVIQDKGEIKEKHSYESSMDKLLQNAVLPLGNTMYIWSGGWNEEDTGAGIEAVTLGVSERWKEFAGLQDASYDFQNTKYQIHDGLDCSGYIGWLVYNTLETENGNEGYVMKAESMARVFASYGFGKYFHRETAYKWCPGDIVSMEDHVWMSLGQCSDGSVLLIHSSPPGVKISGTLDVEGNETEAVRLAEYIMSKYYTGWYERYPDCSVERNYLYGSLMRWNEETLNDENGLKKMSANEIAEWLGYR